MGQAVPELRMTFGDRAALERELQSNLSHGRAFVSASCELAVLDDCTLVLVHPEDGRALALPAQAVMVSAAGIGIQLRPFGAATIATLHDFVASPPPAPSAIELGAADLSLVCEAGEEGAPTQQDGAASPELDAADLCDQGEGAGADEDDDEAAEGEPDGDADAGTGDVQRQVRRHERLRNLNATDQVKLARRGEFSDRIMLERLYGRGVWEALLQNPKLTLPEVATMARKGSMPRPLLELITDNNAWVQSALVRRALLTNPRVSSEAILKLLRMTPKHEVRSIWKTTTYSQLVRETAKKVLEM